MSRSSFTLLLIFLIGISVIIGIIFLGSRHEEIYQNLDRIPIVSSSVVSRDNQVLGIRKKTLGCEVKGPLPDVECTPGAIIEGVTKEQICIPGYSKSVRNVSQLTKNQVYEEYGVTTHQTGEYEIDHLISLELGGSNDIANLFPEAAEPRPGFHEKDQVENYLHEQVCLGGLSLVDAQKIIANNWLEVLNQVK